MKYYYELESDLLHKLKWGVFRSFNNGRFHANGSH